jgi:hypothetical protein
MALQPAASEALLLRGAAVAWNSLPSVLTARRFRAGISPDLEFWLQAAQELTGNRRVSGWAPGRYRRSVRM